MARAFVIKQNDLSRSIKFYLRASPASNFTGATAVFNMREKNGAVKISRGSATIASDTEGFYATYDWVSGDTDTPGNFEAEFEVTLATAKPETYPNEGFIPVKITEEIA